MKILASAYDSTGAVTVGDTDVTVPVDTAVKLFPCCKLVNGEIVLNPSRSTIEPEIDYVILIMAKVSSDATSGNDRSGSRFWIEVDTGGGYAELQGSAGYNYNRMDNEGLDTVTCTGTVDVSKASTAKFRIRGRRVFGTATIQTVAGDSNLIATILNNEV